MRSIGRIFRTLMVMAASLAGTTLGNGVRLLATDDPRMAQRSISELDEELVVDGVLGNTLLVFLASLLAGRRRRTLFAFTSGALLSFFTGNRVEREASKIIERSLSQ
jgi:hypothetical protein